MVRIVERPFLSAGVRPLCLANHLAERFPLKKDFT